MVMKTLAILAVIAVAVSALPSEDKTPARAAAEATITSMLQTGADPSACSDLAQSMLDEVQSSVDAQQKALNDMDNGKECPSAGDSVIEEAENAKNAADAAFATAKEDLTKATATKVHMGIFAFKSLNPDSCGGLFTENNAYGTAHAAVQSATTARDEAEGAAKSAEDDLKAAKEKAKQMVKECKCKVEKKLDETHKQMVADAEDSNKAAWTKAKHMQCVLDGTAQDDCSTGGMPVVQSVGVHSSVADLTCEEWVLAMDADAGFGYDHQRWTGDSGNKWSYYNVKANKIRLVSDDGQVEWTHNQGKTLRDIFSGAQVNSNIGNAGWRSLVSGAGYQNHCNKEGFNAHAASSKVRFGIIMNQENDCNSPDSMIGAGINKGSAGVGAYCGCCQNGGQCTSKPRNMKIWVFKE